MSLYLAAYDIACDRRRTRIARFLHKFGSRVQESVFELWLEPDEVGPVRVGIGSLLDSSDRFDIYPVDERGSRRRASWHREPDAWGAVIVIGLEDPEYREVPIRAGDPTTAAFATGVEPESLKARTWGNAPRP